MGKTADLTVVQKTIIDTLHKEGKTQTFITKEAVHRVLYPSMLTESWVEEKDAQPTERTAALWGLSRKSIQEFGWTSQGMDWGWGQGIKSTTHRRVEEFGYSCHQRRLIWAKRRTGLLPSGPKSSFQMRASVVFHLETKVLESGGRVEKLRAQVAWSPGLSFHSLWWFGCHVICWCWFIVFLKTNVTAPVYQDILEHFMLPSAGQLFKDADLIFQQDLAPVHTAKSTKSSLNDHVLVLTGQQTHQTWTLEDLWSIVERKMRNKGPRMQMSWRPLSKKPGIHTTSAVPQTDHLHATPHWASN